MRRWGAVLGVLLGVAAGCSRPAPPGAVEGRVRWQGQGVAAAFVQVYRKAEQDPSTPAVAEGPSAEDGGFRLEVPPGRYWVWAKATVPGGARDHRLVGQVAGNPVTVAAGATVAVQIELADPSGFSARAGPEGTGAVGRVASGLGAQGEATVYAYRGRSERPLGPGFAAAAPVGADGSFRLHLPPGDYTLALRQRAGGADFGALVPGDRVAVVTVEVRAGAYADVGPLALRPLDPEVRKGVPAGSPPTATALAGRVVDRQGVPVAGLRVLAFTEARMAGRPVALSAPTGPDGAFRVHLPGAGAYFLGARSRLGGPAEPGEKVGAQRGEGGTGVRLEDGEVREGVTVAVEEVW